MLRITLRAARINKNLTQEQVAEMVGVTKKTVGSWESGKTRPKIDKIEPLCELYGVTYDDVLWNV